jgi:hypothetical protein
MKSTLLAAVTLALVGCSSPPSCDRSDAVKAEFIKHLASVTNNSTIPLRLQNAFGSSSLEVYPEITEFKLSGLMTLDEKDGVRYCKAKLKTTKAVVLKLPIERSKLGPLINGLSPVEIDELISMLKGVSNPAEQQFNMLKQVLVNKVVTYGFTDVSVVDNAIIGKRDVSNDKDIIEYSLRYSDDRKAIYVELLK